MAFSMGGKFKRQRTEAVLRVVHRISHYCSLRLNAANLRLGSEASDKLAAEMLEYVATQCVHHDTKYGMAGAGMRSWGRPVFHRSDAEYLTTTHGILSHAVRFQGQYTGLKWDDRKLVKGFYRELEDACEATESALHCLPDRGLAAQTLSVADATISSRSDRLLEALKHYDEDPFLPPGGINTRGEPLGRHNVLYVGLTNGGTVVSLLSDLLGNKVVFIPVYLGREDYPLEFLTPDHAAPIMDSINCQDVSLVMYRNGQYFAVDAVDAIDSAATAPRDYSLIRRRHVETDQHQSDPGNWVDEEGGYWEPSAEDIEFYQKTLGREEPGRHTPPPGNRDNYDDLPF
jgi:hypothetical protein